MGGLHEGHARLIRQAVAGCAEPGSVLVSVYINPLQFGEGEDFDCYPRSLEADCLLAQRSGAAALWCPDDQQIYPGGVSSGLRLQTPSTLQSALCGPSRPGHFDGVCTVVSRLLALVQPRQLWLGEKDWQQLVILRRLVTDLGLPVRVRGCATVREPDGLAASSRNRYLSSSERCSASSIGAALRDAATELQCGRSGQNDVLKSLSNQLENAGLEVEYVEVVDPSTLQPAKETQALRLLATAVHCEDNTSV